MISLQRKSLPGSEVNIEMRFNSETVIPPTSNAAVGANISCKILSGAGTPDVLDAQEYGSGHLRSQIHWGHL